jgi:fibronectin-binding autotransporter adhesin
MILLASALAVSMIVAAPSARATTYTWDNGGADRLWATSSNWDVSGTNPATPPGGSDTATFTGAAPGDVTISGTVNPGTLSFENAGGSYDITGGTLNLLQGILQQTSAVTGSNTISSALDSGTTTLDTVIASGTLTLAGQVTGFTDLTKKGAGTLVLSNSANNYSGATSLFGGTLRLGAANVLPDTQLNITASTLDLGGYSDTVAGLTMTAGSIANSGAAATLTLGGDWTSTGQSYVAPGANIGLDAARNFNVNSGRLAVASAITGAFKITKAGAGTLFLTHTGNTFTSLGLVAGGGQILLGGTNVLPSNLTYTGLAGAYGAMTSFLDLNGYNQTINGQSDSGSASDGFVLLHGATFTIGNNNYAQGGNGPGIKIIGGAGGGGFTKIGTSTQNLLNGTQRTRLGYTGQTFIAGGQLSISYNDAGKNWLFPYMSELNIGSAGTLGVAVASASGGEFTFDGLTGSGQITGAANPRLIIGSNNGSGTWDGRNSMTGSTVVKVGTGTETFTNTNAYTSATLIKGGTLTLGGTGGALTGTSSVTVTQAILNVDNTVAGLDRINNAATVTLNGGTFNFIAHSAGTDETVGNLTFGAGQSLVTDTGSANSSTLTFGTFTAPTAGGTVDFTLPASGNIVTSTANTDGGILSGRATVNHGANWATKSGNNLVALSQPTDSFTTSGVTTTDEFLTGSSVLVGAHTVNSLMITNTTGSPATLNLGANTLTLTSKGLLFNGSADYAITGTTGTLGAPGLEVVLHDWASSTLTIAAPISGGIGAFTKAGSGTTVLTKANTYTGATNIDMGTLQLGVNSAIAPGSAVTIGRGAKLDMAGFTDTVASLTLTGGSVTNSTGTSTLTLGGSVSAGNGANSIAATFLSNGNVSRTFAVGNGADQTDWPDSLTITSGITGTGALVKTNRGTLVLSGSSNYTGATTLTAAFSGIVVAANADAFGATSGITVGATGHGWNTDNADGSQVQLKGGAGISYTARPMTLYSSGIGYMWDGGLRNVQGNNTWNGAITVGPYAMIGVDATTTLTLAGQMIGGANAYLKSGAGTLIFNNTGTASTGTGTLALFEGIAQLGANNQIPDGQSVQINNNATFDVNGKTETIANLGDWDGGAGTLALGTGGAMTLAQTAPYTFAGAITGTGVINLSNAWTWTLAGTSTFTGTANINAGATLKLASSTPLPGTSVLNLAGGSVDVNGINVTIGALAGSSGSVGNSSTTAATLTLNAPSGTAAYSGAIGDGLALVKDGAYTQTLSGANTYAGGTALKTGKLILANASGSALGTGVLTLDGGTLAGTGTTTGAVLAGATAHVISPGDTDVGTLTMGTLTLSSLSTLDFSNITSPSAMDRIVSTGSLNFSGAGAATINLSGGLASGTYKLIDFASAGSATVDNFMIPGAPITYQLSIDPTHFDLNLVVSAANYWQGTAGANWSDSGSWASSVPNAAGAFAYFNGSGGSPVVVDAPFTLGQLRYDSAQSYSIQGSQTLTFSNTAGNASILLASTSASQTVSAPAVLATDLTVTSNAAGLTMSGGITESGSHGLTLAAGTLTLAGTNTYTGDTNLNAGTLKMGAANAAAAGSKIVLAAGATVDLASTNQVIGGLAGSGGTVTSSGAAALTINQPGTTGFGGLIAGGLSVTKSGAGTLMISGANTYGGGTTLAAGRLTLTNAAGSALGTGGLTLNGGTLASGVTGGLTGNLTAGSGAHTISPGGEGLGVLSTGSLYLTSQTTLDFSQITSTSVLDQILSSGSLNFSGGGQASILTPSDLPLGAYTLINFTSAGTAAAGNFAFVGTRPGYSLQLDATNRDLNLIVTPNNWVGADGTNWNNSGGWSFGVIPNAPAALVYFAGAGGSPVLIDAPTTVGSLQYASAASYDIQGPQTLTFDNTTGTGNAAIGLTSASAAQTISASVALANTDLTITSNAAGLTISSALSGAGRNLTMANGLLTLSNAGNALGTLTLQGGSINGAGTITLSTSADLQGGTLGAALAGAAGVQKSTAGTVILTGDNVFSGNTTVLNGTLQTGAADTLSPNSTLVTLGGTVDLASNNQIIANLAGTGGQISSAAPATLTVNQTTSGGYSGLISGAVGLAKSGAATLVLGSANAYTGDTTISNGTLRLGIAQAIPAASTLIVNAGGTLDRNGLALTTNNLTMYGGLVSGSGTLTLGGNLTGTGGTLTGGVLNLGGARRTLAASNGTLHIADQITNGNLTIGAGGGTVVLSNTANNFTGDFQNQGNLRSGASEVIPNASNYQVYPNTVWDLNGFMETIGNLGDTGGGGAINLNGGTLRVGGGGGWYASPTINDGAISGGLFWKNGDASIQNLGGAFNFTGTTRVTTGTLNLGGTSASTAFLVDGGTFNMNVANLAQTMTVTAGTLGLNGNNTGATNVYISGGTFSQNASDRLPGTVQVSMTGGTYSLGAANQTISGLNGSGGTITATTGTLTLNQTSGSSTFSGQLAGGLTLVKAGAGTLTLSSAPGSSNTTGVAMVTNGILRLGTNGQISDVGGLVIAGGTFDLNGNNETVATLTFNGGTLAGAGTLTFTTSMNLQAGFINGHLGGTAPLVKIGVGSALMGGTNLLSSSTPLFINEGTLDLRGNNQIVSTLTLAGGTLAGTGGGSLTASSGSDLQSGLLTASLAGSASVAKTTGGTVRLGAANVLSSTAPLTVSDGVLDLQAYNQAISVLTLGGGTLAGTGGGSLNLGTSANVQAGTLNVSLGGTGRLVKTTGSTVTLSLANTYSGGTTLTDGRLLLANTSGASVLGSGAVVLAGGTLAGVGTISGNVSAGSGAHTISPTGTLTTGSLYLSDQTILDFSNIGTGGLMTSTGSLNLLDTANVAHVIAPVGVVGGSYKLIDAATLGNASSSNFALSGSRLGYSLAVDTGDLILTIVANYWKGTGAGNWSDSANWSLGSPNGAQAEAYFTGQGNSTVVVNAATSIGALIFDGAKSYDLQGPETLTFDNSGGAGSALLSQTSTAAAQTISAPVTLASDLAITANANGLTISGPISGAGKGLTLTGGLLVLSNGANAYTGDTRLNGGTLKMGAVSAVPGESAVVMAGGTLDLNAYSQVVAGLSGTSGTVTNSAGGTPVLTVNQAGDSVFGGLLTGSLALTKSGAGTLVLGAANSYTGNTTLSAGTLKLAVANGVSTASAVTMGNALFDLNGNNQVIAGLSGAGGTVTSATAATLTVNQSTGTSYSGLLAGAMALVKGGSGELILNATNTYTGGTDINGGMLKLGVAAALPITGGVNINPGGTLDRNGFNITPTSLNLNGGTIAGAGTLTLNATLATGAGAITGGTLDLGGGALRRILNVSGGTLTVGDAITNGNLQKEGDGTLVLANPANAFTGGLFGFGVFNAGMVKNGASEVLGAVSYNIENSATWNLNGYYETVSGVESGTDTGIIDLAGGTLKVNSYGGSYNGSIVDSGATGTFIVAADAAGGYSGIQSLNNTAGYSVGKLIQERGNLKTTGLTGTTITAGSIELQSGTLGIGGLRLASANTITKTTSGTLRLGAANVFSSSPLAVSNGVLDIRSYNQAVTALALSGGTLAGTTGVMTLNGNADLQAGVLTTRLSGGTVTKSTDGTVWLGASDVFSSSPLAVQAGTLDVQGTYQTVPTLTLIGGTLAGTGGGTVALSTSADVQVGLISANLSGAAALVKSGAGTAVLSGNNTYTEATTISQGLLKVNGSIASSPVTVNAGGALGGAGTVGNLTLAGGTLRPGDGVGTLAISGPASLAGASTYEWELSSVNGANQDRLTISGDLALGGTSGNCMAIDITSAGLADFINTASYSWILASAGGAITGFDSNGYTFNAIGFAPTGTFSLSRTGSDLVLSYAGNTIPMEWNWTGSAGTTWGTGANWAAGSAPGAGHTAIFRAAGLGIQPNLTGNEDAEGLAFETTGYTISGAGSTLTIGSGGINSTSPATGGNSITANVKLGASQVWTTATGNTLAVNGTLDFNANTLTKTGAGITTLSGLLSTAPGSALVINGGQLNLNSAAGTNAARNLAVTANGNGTTLTVGATQYLAGLTLSNGAQASITAVGTSNASKAIKTNALSITTGAKLDIADNNLVVNYSGATPLQTIETWIKQGAGTRDFQGVYSYDGSAGITSSAAQGSHLNTAIGLRDNGFNLGLGSIPTMTSVEGVPVDSNSIVAKFTFYGDLDLNGKVNIDDYNLFAYYIGAGHNPGPTYTTWMTGDLNYDGLINVNDYNLFTYGYSHQGVVLSADEQITNWAPIPEPATLTLLTLGGLIALAKRRRNSRKA